MSRIAIAIFCLTVSLAAPAQEFRTFMLGSAVPVAPSQRTIFIRADTEWVNVNEDESVKFVAGGVEFAWRFDGPGSRSFDLQQVAPSGALTKTVTVYITRKPQW